MEALRLRVHNDILNLRAIERLLGEHKSSIAWEYANHEQREELRRLVISREKLKIAHWVRKIIYAAKDIDEYSVRELRLLAKSFRILGWSYIGRIQLIRSINECKKNRQNSVTLSIQPKDRPDNENCNGNGQCVILEE